MSAGAERLNIPHKEKTKKNLANIGRIAAAGIVLTSAAFQTEPGKGQNIDYVALGDSVTSGHKLNIEDNYVSLYSNYLEQNREVSTNNLAFPGLTSKRLLSALENSLVFRQQVEDAEIITLAIGLNDFQNARFRYVSPDFPPCEGEDGEACFRQTVSDYRENLHKILAKITQLNPNARIKMLNIYQPYVSNDIKKGTFLVVGNYLAKMNEIVEQTGREFDVQVIDVHEAFNGKDGIEEANDKGLLIDLLHPSRLGSEAILAALEK